MQRYPQEVDNLDPGCRHVVHLFLYLTIIYLVYAMSQALLLSPDDRYKQKHGPCPKWTYSIVGKANIKQ